VMFLVIHAAFFSHGTSDCVTALLWTICLSLSADIFTFTICMIIAVTILLLASVEKWVGYSAREDSPEFNDRLPSDMLL